MKRMDFFGNGSHGLGLEDSAYSEHLGSVNVIKEVSASSYDGELLKWQVIDKQGRIFWLKSSSFGRDGKAMYECEAECIACRIARLLGLQNVVMYNMDTFFMDGQKWKVCFSADYAEGADIMTFAECVPDAVYLHGDEKYQAIAGAFPNHVMDMNKILVFDAIIYNRDRHLNNLMLVDDRLLLFDNGASMFSRDSSPKLAFNSCSFGYQQCKTFYNTVKRQLGLCNGTFLDRISMKGVEDIVACFLSGSRRKWVLKLLDRNLMEVSRFWK